MHTLCEKTKTSMQTATKTNGPVMTPVTLRRFCVRVLNPGLDTEHAVLRKNAAHVTVYLKKYLWWI